MRYYGFNPFIRAYHNGKEGIVYDLLDGNIFKVSPQIVELFSRKIYRSYEDIKKQAIKFQMNEKEIRNIIDEGLNNGIICELGGDYWRNEIIPPIELQAIKKEFIFFYKRVYLQPTGDCNIKCDFCNTFLNCMCFKGKREWSEDELGNILKELGRFKGMIEEVEIWGGNPLLYSGLENLIKGLNRAQPKLVSINIPFFSSIPGIENEILKLKSICKSYFLPTFLLLPENRDSLSILLNLKARINLKIKFLTAEESHCKADMNNIHYGNALFSKEHLLRKDLNNLDWFKNAIKADFLEGVTFYDFYFRKNFHRCWGCSIAIDFNGNVKPCLWSYYTFGSWKDGKIMHVLDNLKNTELFWLDVNMGNIEGCKDCIYRFGCKDCRVITEFLTGNIKSKNPLCPLL